MQATFSPGCEILLLLCSICDFSQANWILITFQLFSSCPCCEDTLHARTKLGSLGVAKLSSIMLITQSFVIPVVRTSLMHDCKCGIPWGSSVPRSTFFLHHQDSLILVYFRLPLSQIFIFIAHHCKGDMFFTPT